MVNAPSQFEFVITDPSVSFKPGKSSAIRSRCMQGKNKREGSRRSRMEKKRSDAAKHRAPLHQEASRFEQMPPSLNTFALVRFASQVSAEAQDVLFNAFASSFASQALFPLDHCVDFDCIESETFPWLFSDAAFLHSMLSSSYAINDLLVPPGNGQPGRMVMSHLRTTLALLAKKMDSETAHEDEAVLYVVINLALLAAVYGDWEAAAAHFAGLHRIVQMRGGMDFLRTRPKVHFKLDRLDLAWSLSSGRKPFFINQTVAWDSTLEPPQTNPGLYQPSVEWDIRLFTVFRDFQYMAIHINANVRKHERFKARCFQKVLSSLQSRLMHLAGMLDDPTGELVRLSLLAFLTTTFKVPGRKIPYTWVAKYLKKAYRRAANGPIRSDPILGLWVLMVAAISVIHVQEQWLQEAWRAAGVAFSWTEAQKCLVGVMWIECIHDGPGLDALEHLGGDTSELL